MEAALSEYYYNESFFKMIYLIFLIASLQTLTHLNHAGQQ